MMASASVAHSRPKVGTSPLRFALAKKKRSSPFVSEPSCRSRRCRVDAPRPTAGLAFFAARPLLASLDRFLSCDLLFFGGIHVRSPIVGFGFPILPAPVDELDGARL